VLILKTPFELVKDGLSMSIGAPDSYLRNAETKTFYRHCDLTIPAGKGNGGLEGAFENMNLGNGNSRPQHTSTSKNSFGFGN